VYPERLAPNKRIDSRLKGIPVGGMEGCSLPRSSLNGLSPKIRSNRAASRAIILPMNVRFSTAAGFLDCRTTLELLARGLQVSMENLSWHKFLQPLGKVPGKLGPLVALRTAQAKLGDRLVTLAHSIQGREGGLCLALFVVWQTLPALLDPDFSARELGYAFPALEADFVNTARASLPAGRKCDE